MAEENVLMQEKIRKLNELKEKGINPYPYTYDQSHHAADILSKYDTLKNEEKIKDNVSVAGRIMTMRRMGKATFMHIQDETGKIQLYLRQDDIGKENYSLLKKLDIGDIIGVKGNVFRTKMGEISVYAKECTILTKSIRPLPEKFHGLQDPELRYRQRALDLIMNPEVREIFFKRSRIINLIRLFMEKKGFIEVEVPLLQTQYGGAKAKPFVTHINAWDMDMYLAISPELYLKRLLVGGFEKVYTLCKNFRNEGVDRTHNPEFTMIEFYMAYADYNTMMQLTEELFEFICKEMHGKTKIEYMGKPLDFTRPWKKITMNDSIKEYADIDVEKLSDDELKKKVKELKIDIGKFSRGKAVEALFEELVEEKLIQPTFIIDYPKESTPLTKVHRKNPELVERFEFFINGAEVGNAYSELNDPIVQRKLLEKQAKELSEGEEEAHPMDEEFVRSMEIGMPPAGGIGIGVDRLVMLMTGAHSLRDVILFPTMKPEKD